MRSELAHDIFRQDFANLYEEQNQVRAALKSGAEDVIRQKVEDLKGETLVNDEIERMMVLLSERLKKYIREKGIWVPEAGCEKSGGSDCR